MKKNCLLIDGENHTKDNRKDKIFNLFLFIFSLFLNYSQ
ncbi:hypothetical protein HSIEG1_1380 [Enterococcus sp. HSIEG1]|nr:hypothetical protein HSIEG1_1380 [Enterococcus sp. HSIEG1]